MNSEMFDRDDYPYSDTFVREALQNSLDARLDGNQPVKVNFTFHEEELGPRRNFISGAISYRRDAGKDIPEDWNEGRIRWLVVEDFNTTGLKGDLEDRLGDFWNYWMNFCLSNKDAKGRGGRGIGRVTFLISSRIQSVIGYTRRAEDGSRAVCGMTVLRVMKKDSDLLSTHAYLARDIAGNVLDLHGNDTEADAQKAFCFKGYEGKHSSGLALAIPYPRKELTRDCILAAVIENFAPAVMDRTLVVNVDGTVLNSGSIAKIGESPDVVKSFKNQAVKEDPGRYLKILQQGLASTKFYKISLLASDKKHLLDWFGSETIQKVRNSLENGGVEVLKIDFPVERTNASDPVSLLAVVSKAPVCQETSISRKPIDRLFRQGMLLPDVKTRMPNDLDLVLLVTDNVLASYMNLCEGKAHLDLLRSKDVVGKLKPEGFKIQTRDFIKKLPELIRQLLAPEITEPDPDVFRQFFGLPDSSRSRKETTEPTEPTEAGGAG